ncbi:MAG TPA: PRC-barrel domain-containing protein [Candidatus Angelobacter sp.]|nr:PRC-barrel domain-containing protein [Candidatus Angelobacter sp.]
MPHYGVLREYKLEEVDDVRGAEVYGVNDEKLGTIDDVIFDHSTGEIRYIVVKTGGRIGGKRIMVPASRIEPYGRHDDKFYAELDPERLEMMPEFDEQRLKSESEWSKYEKDYEKRWNDGAVMYDKETMRVITPAHEDVVPQPGRPLSQEAKKSLNRDFTPQRVGKQDAYLGVASGSDKTTLRPARPSVAGREDAIRQNTGRDLRQSDAVPEIAGRPDLNRQNVGRENLHDETMNHGRVPGQTTREVEGVMSTEFEVSSSPESTPQEAMREPGVYKLDPVPEAGQNTQTSNRDVTEAPNEALNAGYGRRWTAFQKHLRDRRDKVVSGCNLCGTQEKVA